MICPSKYLQRDYGFVFYKPFSIALLLMVEIETVNANLKLNGTKTGCNDSSDFLLVDRRMNDLKRSMLRRRKQLLRKKKIKEKNELEKREND